MSSNKGKIINHKGVQYIREKTENIGSCGECELNTNFNEVCKYSRECELTGTILKKRIEKEIKINSDSKV